MTDQLLPKKLLRENPTDFFHGLLREALAEQRVSASTDAEFYLVALLERFMRVEQGFFSRPLALDYLESFEGDPPVRYRKLKNVGDTALFVCGVFLESLDDKLVGPAYYSALGELAYGHLARLSGTSVAKAAVPLFTEMSVRFVDFVRVLAEMSDTGIFTSDQDVLRIYRRWFATRGARDAERLARRGIIPFAPRKTPIQ